MEFDQLGAAERHIVKSVQDKASHIVSLLRETIEDMEKFADADLDKFITDSEHKEGFIAFENVLSGMIQNANGLRLASLVASAVYAKQEQE